MLGAVEVDAGNFRSLRCLLCIGGAIYTVQSSPQSWFASLLTGQTDKLAAIGTQLEAQAVDDHLTVGFLARYVHLAQYPILLFNVTLLPLVCSVLRLELFVLLLLALVCILRHELIVRPARTHETLIGRGCSLVVDQCPVPVRRWAREGGSATTTAIRRPPRTSTVRLRRLLLLLLFVVGDPAGECCYARL